MRVILNQLNRKKKSFHFHKLMIKFLKKDNRFIMPDLGHKGKKSKNRGDGGEGAAKAKFYGN